LPIDEHLARSLREWRRTARKRLRERGWAGKPVPEDDINRLTDELLARVFKSEWMEALRQSDEDERGPSG
jgi:hypothetical protein